MRKQQFSLWKACQACQLNFHHRVILIYWGVRAGCAARMALIFFRQGLGQARGLDGGGAISLTQEFPPLSSHIRDAAPYGRQILMLAGEWPRIIHRYLCAWGKDIFFQSDMLRCSFCLYYDNKPEEQMFGAGLHGRWYESCKTPNIVHLWGTACISPVDVWDKNIWIMRHLMQGWWSVAKQSLGSPLSSQFTSNDLMQQIPSFHQLFTKQNIKYPAVVTVPASLLSCHHIRHSAGLPWCSEASKKTQGRQLQSIMTTSCCKRRLTPMQLQQHGIRFRQVQFHHHVNPKVCVWKTSNRWSGGRTSN